MVKREDLQEYLQRQDTIDNARDNSPGMIVLHVKFGVEVGSQSIIGVVSPCDTSQRERDPCHGVSWLWSIRQSKRMRFKHQGDSEHTLSRWPTLAISFLRMVMATTR